MYKFERYRQLGLADFNQPAGLKMNPDNRWVQKAVTIPWDELEDSYATLFSGKKIENCWNKSRKIRITSTSLDCRDSRRKLLSYHPYW